MYTVDLSNIIEQHGLHSHLYADDTQIYGSCHPNNVNSFTTQLTSCVNGVFDWLRSNRLQPNPDKTEMMWCSTARRQQHLPADVLSFGGAIVSPSKSVRNLGIYLDSALSMHEHVTKTVSRCFSALRQLRTVRRHVPNTVFQSLVTTLVLSRLDYGNVVLAGVSKDQLRRLQAVQNAAARLVFSLRCRDHVSDALLQLHWLKILSASNINF